MNEKKLAEQEIEQTEETIAETEQVLGKLKKDIEHVKEVLEKKQGNSSQAVREHEEAQRKRLTMKCVSGQRQL